MPPDTAASAMKSRHIAPTAGGQRSCVLRQLVVGNTRSSGRPSQAIALRRLFRLPDWLMSGERNGVFYRSVRSLNV